MIQTQLQVNKLMFIYDDAFKTILGIELGLTPEQIVRYTDIKLSTIDANYGSNSAATTISDYCIVCTLSSVA